MAGNGSWHALSFLSSDWVAFSVISTTGTVPALQFGVLMRTSCNLRMLVNRKKTNLSFTPLAFKHTSGFMFRNIRTRTAWHRLSSLGTQRKLFSAFAVVVVACLLSAEWMAVTPGREEIDCVNTVRAAGPTLVVKFSIILSKAAAAADTDTVSRS